MRSPVYPDVPLVLQEMEPDLSVYRCPKSGGVWIPLQNYFDWQRRQPAPLSLPATAEPVLAGDAEKRALICPESGRLLLRYLVGHGLAFHIERSPVTGGVWLDRGEWDALKSKGLHVELHLIFTAAYQRGIRTQEYAATMEQTFRERIGEQDFSRAVEIRSWLRSHPRRHEIGCYLLSEFDSPIAPLR